MGKKFKLPKQLQEILMDLFKLKFKKQPMMEIVKYQKIDT